MTLSTSGVTLEGAGKGIAVFFTPDFSVLLDPNVWMDAAGQIFFRFNKQKYHVSMKMREIFPSIDLVVISTQNVKWVESCEIIIAQSEHNSALTLLQCGIYRSALILP